MPKPMTTAPVELYRDLAVFERERELVFAKSWQFFGLESDLVRPGDYLAETLAGYPIMVVRDEHSALRGYHNVCRHRAGPLVGEAKGRCDREFVCHFHEWRYGFDGRLNKPTGFGPADGFDPADYSLFAIRVETWRGFIFVNLDLDASALADLLRPLDERLGRQPRRPARVRDSHPAACNWKVFVENYLDGYHLEGVHPEHGAEHAAHKHNIHIEGDIAFCEASSHGGEEDSLWAWIWPNLGLSVYRGVLMIEHMRPEGPDRTRIDHVFLHEPEDPSVDAAIVNAERVSEDDVWISERVQRNLDAGMFRQGVLSPSHEEAVAWFQSRIAETLAGGASKTG